MNPVVIDTNCLLQIIAKKSPYRPIWDAFLEGKIETPAKSCVWYFYKNQECSRLSPRKTVKAECRVKIAFKLC